MAVNATDTVAVPLHMAEDIEVFRKAATRARLNLARARSRNAPQQEILDIEAKIALYERVMEALEAYENK